ncbi:N-acetyltransferase [Baekduia soli]|uniref:N-acetyltransferase n=1 Tax=Baekduia soli TaxID=496014 RepID=A0A5B8U348_9ACTN|nr:GNAT family N-acetyltransferase [Baekduia soli]QEC47361.1 N-acetyltransferase [Baekduia soli]
MDPAVRDNPGSQRYEITADGAVAGFAQYRLRPGLIAFIHTEVDEAMTGRGLGRTLIASALQDARARSLAVLPFCPFVSAYLQRHPDDQDLVPEAYRNDFGL